MAAGLGESDATLEFADVTASTAGPGAGTTYTFTGVGLGTAAADRTVILAAYVFNGGTSHTATLDGSSMTDEGSGQVSVFRSTIFTLAHATGTTATIVISTGGNPYNCGIATWAAYGIGDEFDQSAVSGEVTDINIPAGGVAIGYSVNHNTNYDATWTNMTKRFGEAVDFTGHSGADTTSATEVNPDITCDWPTRDSGPFIVMSWSKA